MREEVAGGGDLPFFHFAESVAEDARLFFDVLKGKCAVAFQLLEAFVDGFVEGFLGRGLRLGLCGVRG